LLVHETDATHRLIGHLRTLFRESVEQEGIEDCEAVPCALDVLLGRPAADTDGAAIRRNAPDVRQGP
jgi:hypothetical protein